MDKEEEEELPIKRTHAKQVVSFWLQVIGQTLQADIDVIHVMKWLPSSWFFALLKAIKNWMVKVHGNDGTRHNTVKWETFEGENFRELVKNMLFMDCSLLQHQRCHAPKFCGEKLSRIATKPWSRESFLSQKFPAIRYYNQIFMLKGTWVRIPIARGCVHG